MADDAPRLIYGCMNIGGGWDESPPDDAARTRAFAALDAAVKAGIHWFDHADIYCRSKSEALFGEWLGRSWTPDRDSLVIQSKLGIRFPGDGGERAPGRYDFSRAHILRSVDGILDRLGTDHLDVLLLHRPDVLADPREVGATLGELVDSGRVRRCGVSNHSASRIEYLQQHCEAPLEINQLELSLAHRQLVESEVLVNQRPEAGDFSDRSVLDYCRIHGIAVQAWSPLARGIYSGGDPSMGGPSSAELRAREQTAEEIARLAREHHCSREAAVLGWIRRIPGGIVPVIGTMNPQRIAACAEEVELSREEWYRLFVLARGAALP